MKITSINITCYGSEPDGRINAHEGDNSVSFAVTAEEARQIFAVAESLVLARKSTIASAIANMQPMALPAPEADYDEVL